MSVHLEVASQAQVGLARRQSRRDPAIALRIASLLAFFGIWQLLAMLGIFTPVLLPPPTSVLAAAGRMLVNGVLLPNIAVSLLRVVAGFSLATVVAVPLEIMAGWSANLRNIVEPITEFFRPIPVLAMLPLAILWFGIGKSSKIFLIAYGSFFPIFLNTASGVRFVDPIFVQAAASLGATKWQIFRRVVLMAAMPDIATGLRLGLGFSFLTLVAAEMIASQQGLGYLIVDTQLTFQTDQTLVATLTFGVLGYLMGAILVHAEARLLRWRKGLQTREH